MKIINALVLASFFMACNQEKTDDRQAEAPNEINISEEKTEEVLSHHWEAFMNNDLEETMKDYTDESVLVTPDATYTGLEEIRTNFVNAFRAFPKDSTTFTLDKSLAAQDIGYILWKSKTPAFNLTFATDTFIIRDGKIVRQTFAGVFE